MKPFDITPSGRLSGVSEYFFSRKLSEIEQMRAAGKEVVNLGIGGPDLPPHPAVIETLARETARENTHSYQPNKGTALLRGAFGRWYGERYGVALDPATEILPLIGSKEGILDICMSYLNPGDHVLVPNPGYPTYRSAVALAGGVCVDYVLGEATGWLPDFEALDTAARQGGVKMMLVNYPHMPTGTLPTLALFERLVAFAREHAILLVHDNPYGFIRNPRPMSLLSVAGAREVVVELNSLSKSHNMAGWRVGMIGGRKERIDEILRFRSNMDSGMFYPVQAAAAAALALGDEWYASLNDVYYSRQAAAGAVMDAIGCTCAPDQGGLFIWGRLPEGAEDSFAYSDGILRECGVFITPGGVFGSQGDRYMRVSLCAPVEVFEHSLQKIENVFLP
jgi:aspartate/methionine/tyrosine aminotransferase